MTEVDAARSERGIADGPRGGAASKQASDKGEDEEFGCGGDEVGFHGRGVTHSCWFSFRRLA